MSHQPLRFDRLASTLLGTTLAEAIANPLMKYIQPSEDSFEVLPNPTWQEEIYNIWETQFGKSSSQNLASIKENNWHEVPPSLLSELGDEFIINMKDPLNWAMGAGQFIANNLKPYIKRYNNLTKAVGVMAEEYQFYNKSLSPYEESRAIKYSNLVAKYGMHAKSLQRLTYIDKIGSVLSYFMAAYEVVTVEDSNYLRELSRQGVGLLGWHGGFRAGIIASTAVLQPVAPLVSTPLVITAGVAGGSIGYVGGKMVGGYLYDKAEEKIWSSLTKT